ncbi:DsrE family protein [Jonesia quinghaiensis]|uniref:DsrE family protein n=1 Tax=Jonesia quinghaiensis TaxID=262806 RepID=UPI0003F96567|nr:DsrE family protein [Jonesia quinghaiensis]
MSALVVKSTQGIDAPELTNQAFTVAAAAVAAGVEVSVWLTGNSALLATPGGVRQLNLEHAVPLEELMTLLRQEGTVTVCSQCAARRNLRQEDLLDGVRIAGAPAFVEEIMRPGAQALVY